MAKIKFQVVEKRLNENGKNFTFKRDFPLRINDGLLRYGQIVKKLLLEGLTTRTTD